MLSISNLEVVYNDVVLALRGVSLELPEQQIVALLGANGAGKTTVLRAISGLLRMHDAEVTKGDIRLGDESLLAASPARIVRSGLTQVLEGRRVFAEFTVEENLRAGAYTDAVDVPARMEEVLSFFPALKDRRQATAGYLSGGEQQMLAIARALMSRPTYLLLDEPSLGLAPLIVEQVMEIIREINRHGTSVLLVEQNAMMALSIASHGYVLENGAIVMDKPAAELLADDDIQEFYLGQRSGNDGSFRDLKQYKRRKRWLS
ncbi:ABC transporter ATP-binding protein [Nitriliruptor alkaliphilus]|uniref:ABC transporter ATP-binding protein n=1 Tax=Nitriliruptor alkaliphilus TaxID=427918 RepID=UPI000699103C|nr:ABC transporter ATP-binding protein [Nitriliruptor alkaliphilus]